LKLDKRQLRRIFATRNKIVHELDIDFSAARRNRVQRTVKEMVEMTNNLLELSQRIVELVRKKVPQDQS
jgi:hypothetical protein